ncbi:MAG: hypothetical protein Q7R81_03875 [Candidatus Peregrinibacteria bacterium]|nr:hypothetical protein [Candidatus Peregrinibacteria bacterium]
MINEGTPAYHDSPPKTTEHSGKLIIEIPEHECKIAIPVIVHRTSDTVNASLSSGDRPVRSGARVGLSEDPKFAEGYEAIFGKKNLIPENPEVN